MILDSSRIFHQVPFLVLLGQRGNYTLVHVLLVAVNPNLWLRIVQGST